MNDDFERGAIYDWLKNERRLCLRPLHKTTDAELLSGLWQEAQLVIDQLAEIQDANAESEKQQ